MLECYERRSKVKSTADYIDELTHLREDAANLYKTANELLVEAHTLEIDAQDIAIEIILREKMLGSSDWRMSRYSVENAFSQRWIVLEGGEVKLWDNLMHLLEPEYEHAGWDIDEGVRLRLDDGHVTLRFDSIDVLSKFDNEHRLPIYLEEVYDFIDESKGAIQQAEALIDRLLKRKEEKITEELGYDQKT
jgi:hypothetical protein